MKLTPWLPLVAAPLIGIAFGVGLYRDTRPAGGVAALAAAAPGTVQDAPAKSGWFGLSLGDLAPGSGSGPAISPARSAFEAALRLPAGEAKTLALQSAFSRWMVATPAEASAHVASIPAEARRTVVTAALAALARSAPGSVGQIAAMLGQDGSDLAAVVAAIAEHDPALALDWIGRHPQLDAKGALTAAALPGLIHKDVMLAARTVGALGQRAPVALIQQVAAAYAQHDPARAYAWAEQMAATRTDLTPARLMDDISSSLAARNQDAATEFMERTDDDAVRKSLMSELAIRKGQDDLGEAWTWLEQHSADPAHAQAAQNLLYRWSYTKPEQVAHIVQGMADDAVQATAAAHLTQFWQQKDPAAFQRWVATLPPGQLRERVLAAQ